MKAILYVDGFNFYKMRLQKSRQYRWLNLSLLAERLAPEEATIERIKFYTAYVSGRIDPAAVVKQQTYLAALKTLPNVEIHSGNFIISERWVKLVHPPAARPDGYQWPEPYPEFVFVATPQEKGSDVKLGVHLVRDAFQGAFDIAYVITNDTDLVEPIRIATEELGKNVVVVAPRRPRHVRQPIPAVSLSRVATNVAYIDDADLAASQFPDRVLKANGRYLQKPGEWV